MGLLQFVSFDTEFPYSGNFHVIKAQCGLCLSTSNASFSFRGRKPSKLPSRWTRTTGKCRSGEWSGTAFFSALCPRSRGATKKTCFRRAHDFSPFWQPVTHPKTYISMCIYIYINIYIYIHIYIHSSLKSWEARVTSVMWQVKGQKTTILTFLAPRPCDFEFEDYFAHSRDPKGPQWPCSPWWNHENTWTHCLLVVWDNHCINIYIFYHKVEFIRYHKYIVFVYIILHDIKMFILSMH